MTGKTEEVNIGCPICGGPLERVLNFRGSMLNDYRFDAVRAGDYYCERCKGTEAKSGFKYFWNRELTREGRKQFPALVESLKQGASLGEGEAE